MKILAIGNSFSQDATAYLRGMAESGGMEVKAVNLYIPGCPLKTHWENAAGNRAAYDYQIDGESTGRTVSLEEALREDGWDVVVMQQASHDSGLADTYEPYLSLLSAYVAHVCKGARQMLHQTWAYENGCSHPEFTRYLRDSQTMYRALCDTYGRAARRLHVPLIPSGEVIQSLRARREFDYEHGGQSLCRDGFHMHLPYGRYAVAAVWYESVLRGNILENPFVPGKNAEAAAEPLLRIIRQTVHGICGAK